MNDPFLHRRAGRSWRACRCVDAVIPPVKAIIRDAVGVDIGRGTIEAVMAAQTDLVEIVHPRKQVVCVKS